LWQTGVTEVTDTIKMIASSEEFSAQAWSQGELDAPATRSGTALTDPANPLDRMFRRGATRGFADDDSELPSVIWGTASCTITTHRPLPAVVVGEHGADIAPGVMAAAPSGSPQVSAPLMAGGSATRDVDSDRGSTALRATLPGGR